MRAYAALLLVSVLLVACDRSSPTALEDTPLELVTVLEATSSGFLEPERTTVRGPAEWAGTWQTLHAGLSPLPTLPAIDFDREMVVVAAAGTRPSGCFAINITAARLRRNGAPQFDVLETVPGPNCVCTLALTQPVHVVKVARVSGPATFVERQAELRC